MNHKVYAPCRYCGEVLSYSDRHTHKSICPKNPMAVTCIYCGVRINVRWQWRKHINGLCPNLPAMPDGHKLCSTCQRPKPLEAFAYDNRGAGTHHGQCKECKNRITVETRKDPAEKAKKHFQNIRWYFGITREQYEALLRSQNGTCAICHQPPDKSKKGRYLHVDHDHKTGKTRGLLCMACNLMIGKAKENSATLHSGGDYITEWANRFQERTA